MLPKGKRFSKNPTSLPLHTHTQFIILVFGSIILKRQRMDSSREYAFAEMTWIRAITVTKWD